MGSDNLYTHRPLIKNLLSGLDEDEKRYAWKELVKISSKKVGDILDGNKMPGNKNFISKNLGVEYEDTVPESENAIEIEEYMQQVGDYFDKKLTYIHTKSIVYGKGKGAKECIKKLEKIYERITEDSVPNLQDLEEGIHSVGDQDNMSQGETCVKYKYNIPGENGEYIVMEFESDAEDQLLYKHDRIVLENLFQQKNLSKVIPETSEKIKEKYSDGMTGLFNSVYYDAVINRPNHNRSGIFIDIKMFKVVNDKHGQKTGDLAIKKVAKELENLVRQNDKVVRLGGDEFFILFDNEEVTDKKQLDNNVQSLVKRINNLDIKVDSKKTGQEVKLNLAVGYAVNDNTDEEIIKELSKVANENTEKDPYGNIYRMVASMKNLSSDGVCLLIEALLANDIFSDNIFATIFRKEPASPELIAAFGEYVDPEYIEKMNQPLDRALGTLIQIIEYKMTENPREDDSNISIEKYDRMSEFIELVGFARHNLDDLSEFIAEKNIKEAKTMLN